MNGWNGYNDKGKTGRIWNEINGFGLVILTETHILSEEDQTEFERKM